MNRLEVVIYVLCLLTFILGLLCGYNIWSRSMKGEPKRPPTPERGVSKYLPKIFARWLQVAKRGDRFIYHKGLLMVDREKLRVCSEDGWIVCPNLLALNAVADLALEAYNRGLVRLFQKRLGGGGYEYRAIRTKERLV